MANLFEVYAALFMKNDQDEVLGWPVNRKNPGWRWRLFWWLCVVRPYRIVHYWIFWQLLKKDNAYMIGREANRHRGQICLTHNFEPAKLLGWVEVPNDDYYWVLQPIRYLNKQGQQKFELHSCVGSPSWLKWRVNPWLYRQIEDIFYLNSEPEEDVKKDLQKRGLKLL